MHYSRTQREKHEERMYMKTQHVLFANAIGSLDFSYITSLLFIIICFFYIFAKNEIFLLSALVVLKTGFFQPSPYEHEYTGIN